jgi:hypothetical protein
MQAAQGLQASIRQTTTKDIYSRCVAAARSNCLPQPALPELFVVRMLQCICICGSWTSPVLLPFCLARHLLL